MWICGKPSEKPINFLFYSKSIKPDADLMFYFQKRPNTKRQINFFPA